MDAAALILLIGWLGYYQAERPSNWVDYARVTYLAARLPVSGGDADLIGINPALTAAALLAPLIGFGIALSVTRSLWIDRFDAWRARRMRDHVVVVGLGPNGRSIAQGLKRAGHGVVAIEATITLPAIDAVRSMGVRVIIGDGTEPGTLQSAAVSSAQSIYVFPGRDETAVQCLDAVRAVNSSRTRSMLRATVNVEDSGLRSELQLQEFTLGDALLDVRFVAVADIAADIAVRKALSTLGGRRVVCVGDRTFTSAVCSIAEDQMLSARPLAALALFDQGGQSGESTEAKSAMECPYSDLSTLDASRDAEHIRSVIEDTLGASSPDAVLVSFADNGSTRRWALKLSGAIRGDGCPVVAVLREAPSVNVGGTCGQAPSAIADRATIVDLGGALLQEQYAPKGIWVEPLARVLHERYLRQAAEEGWQGDAIVPWDQLADHYKDANIAQARGAPGLLEAIGCVMEPGVSGVRPYAPTAADLETLADAEHERWMAERKRSWERLSDAQRARAQDLMIPYAELAPTQRRKDREAVLTLLECVAQIGFRVRKRDSNS